MCTDFDLTAKEISSNKRPLQLKKKNIHSPVDGDGAPSNSETVKWAFTNKDSQETQKKVSVMSRPELISRSLKSHDSANSTPDSIQGKHLDFGGDHMQSAFYSSNKQMMTSESEELKQMQNDDAMRKVKYVPTGKVAEVLEKIVDNSAECGFCHEQKIFDSSLQCSKLEQAKSH